MELVYRNNMNKKLDKFLNKENKRKLLLEMAEKAEELEDGTHKKIQLSIPVEIQLNWDKESNSCESEWWSEDFMKDAILYYIESLVEGEIEDLRKQMNKEIKKVVEFCETEGVSVDELLTYNE